MKDRAALAHHGARRHYRGESRDDHEHQVRELGMSHQDDFLGEHQPAHRRIEGGGDAGAGAGGDQHLGAIGREPPQLRDCGADRPSDLRDRAFATDRCARTERERGAECL